MSSDQGWFESDDDYRDRVAREANESTIQSSTGSAPSHGWFEGDDGYRDRIAREANECRIKDESGSSPSQGWFESDEGYSSRIEREANEHTIESSTGSQPSQGWFEGDEAYAVRVRKEANENLVNQGTGSSPTQGWFEGDHAYRSRIAHEARELQATTRAGASHNSGSSSRSTYTDSGGTASGSTESSSSFSGIFIVVLLSLAAGFVVFSPRSGDYPTLTSTQQSVAQKPIAKMNWQAPNRLGIRGFGALQIGMTYLDVNTSLNDQLSRAPGQDDSCYYAEPTAPSEGIYLMFTNGGRLARIDVTSSKYLSVSGAYVGQAQDALVEMYSGRLIRSPHKYDDHGYYFTFTPTDAQDSNFRMIFETDGTAVTAFRAGQLPEVEAVEGCL